MTDHYYLMTFLEEDHQYVIHCLTCGVAIISVNEVDGLRKLEEAHEPGTTFERASILNSETVPDESSHSFGGLDLLNGSVIFTSLVLMMVITLNIRGSFTFWQALGLGLLGTIFINSCDWRWRQ